MKKVSGSLVAFLLLVVCWSAIQPSVAPVSVAVAQNVEIDTSQPPVVVNSSSNLGTLTVHDGRIIIIRTGAASGLMYYSASSSATIDDVDVINGPGGVGRYLRLAGGSGAAALADVANKVADVTALLATSPTDNQLYQTLGYTTEGVGANLYRYDAASTATIDGGFVLPGPGGTLSFSGTTFNGNAGTGGRFIAVDQTVADVTKFGALGDGSTDDTNAVKRALASSMYVYFPSIGTGRTTYKCTELLTMLLGQTVYGDGPYASTLQWTGQPSGAALTTADLTTIERIGFIGEDSAGKDGVGVIDSTRVVMRDIELQNFDNNITIDLSWIVTLQDVYSLSAVNAAIEMPGTLGEVNSLTIIGGDVGTSAYGIRASCVGYNWDIQGLAIQSCTTAGILSDGGGVKTVRCFVYCEANGVNQIHLNGTSSDINWQISGTFSGALSGSDIKITKGMRCRIDPSTFHQSRTHVELAANSDQTFISQCVGPSGADRITITDSGTDTRIEQPNGSIYLGGLNGTPTIDWRSGPVQDFIINGNITATTFTAPPVAHTHLTLYIKQNATGGFTMTWPTLRTAAPTIASGANKETVVTLYYDGSGYFVTSSITGT